MAQNIRNKPVMMNGATAGYIRLFITGAVTQGNYRISWTSEGIPQLELKGVIRHRCEVIHCLNCGKLRTDESDWAANQYGEFCSARCEADYYSKNSRRGLKGSKARAAQR
jgi:hypothetical protein